MSTGHQVLSFVTSDKIATSEITKGSEIATRFGMALGEITAAKDTCCVVEFVIVFAANGFRMLFPDGYVP